jgi:hypothetical protein
VSSTSSGAVFDAAVPALVSEVGLGRLWTVLALATRTGIAPGALAGSATPVPDMTVARQLRDAVRAGYDADGWRRVAQPIFDTLRQRRRDALAAWIMQHNGLTDPDDLASEALFGYLRGLEPLARLDVRSVHLEHVTDPAGNTLHVVARTFAAPYSYFYRTYQYGVWTPWVPVTVPIDGDHLTAAVWQDRLHLFWVTFLEHGDSTSNDGKSVQDLAGQPVDQVRSPRWIDVQLHWAEYHQGTWTQPVSGGLDTPVSEKVDTQWTAADQAIQVSFDGDAILIDLSRPSAKQINQAFRLENKNTPPQLGAHHDPPAVPYTTWTPDIKGPVTVPIDSPLWVTHSEPQGTVTDHILEVGSDWTLRTIDNPVTGQDAQTAALADPFFYAPPSW